MANTKLPARLLDTSAIPALNVTGDLTVDTTTLKVDSTNNRVGIGTSSPDQLLSVKGRISSDLDDDYYGAWLDGNSAAGQDNFLGLGPWHSNAGYIKFLQSSSPDRLSIYTTNTGDHVTLQEAGGKVGIGTTSPRRHFHIHNSASATTKLMITNGATGESNDGQGFQVGIDGSGNALLENRENTNLTLYTNNNPRMTILAGGNVGIGDSTPQALLDVGGGYGGNTSVATFAHATDAYIEIENMTTQNGAGIILTNAGTKKWTIQKDTSTHGLYIQDASTNANMTFLQGGNVGIGTTSPSSELHVKGTNETQVWIDSATNTNPGVRFLENGTNKWTIANDSTNDGFFFYDFTASAERMRIDSDGTLSTSLGSNVSTVSGSTAQLIHWNPDLILVTDSSTGSASYRDMHSFTAHKSGPLKVRWEAANQSGTYYWAGRFLVDGVQMKKTDGNNALHYFGSSLASGHSASVHSFRFFEMDLASVKPGQVIKYQMVSANGSGGPVDGNGQKNRLRSFGVYSTTPTNMGMPVIGYTQGGATAAHQDMTGLTIGSLGADNKGGIALKTQFAIQNEWNDICVIGAGMTGVTFLINATRDLDQNRHKSALVRFAYNVAFTELANSQQNTTIEYRYSDNRIQYRFTSAGNMLVQILVMAGG